MTVYALSGIFANPPCECPASLGLDPLVKRGHARVITLWFCPGLTRAFPACLAGAKILVRGHRVKGPREATARRAVLPAMAESWTISAGKDGYALSGLRDAGAALDLHTLLVYGPACVGGLLRQSRRWRRARGAAGAALDLYMAQFGSAALGITRRCVAVTSVG